MSFRDEITKRVGGELREARQEMGIIQKQLAEKAGLTRNEIQRLEAGSPGMPWSKLAAVLEVVGSTPSIKYRSGEDQ